jgi:signal peptidase I
MGRQPRQLDRLARRVERGFVPYENLSGRAEIIFFSIDENASAGKLVEWPWTVRWERLLRPIK